MKTEMEVLEVKRTVRVPRQFELRKRLAATFVKMAQNFHSDILVGAGSVHIDAKSSLMALMVINALKGQMLELSARGHDAPQAIKALLKGFVKL